MNGHELLPWYLNRTLDPDEARRFEEHLSACGSCRAELEATRTMLGRLGPEGAAGLLAGHPEPPEILAALSPGDADVELSGERAQEVARHVSSCVVCRQEAGWLQGTAVARRRAAFIGPAWLGWAAAAAVIVLAASLGVLWWTLGTQAPGGAYGLTRPVLVTAAQRAPGEQVFEAPVEGGPPVTLIFEVDLAPADLPASFTLRTAAGRVIQGPRQLGLPDLHRGAFVLFVCRSAECPPGDYIALIEKRGAPPATYTFRLN